MNSSYDEYKTEVFFYLSRSNGLYGENTINKYNDEIMYGYENGITSYEIAMQIAADEAFYLNDNDED